MLNRGSIPSSGRGDRGQATVLFALALVAIIAMVGLVLDGGAVFAQRRDQQNAADLAALAGANDYLLSGDETAATTVAMAAAARNGYTDGTAGATVHVSFNYDNGAQVKVDINAPHHNNFAGIVGQGTWNVSTTATAITGIPDTVNGAAPVIFSIDAFDSNGDPLAAYSDPNNPYDFGDGNGDVPNNAGDIAWTNYGTGNVDTSVVDAIIQGQDIINKELDFGEYIGQHNQGYHNNQLFSDANTYLTGTDVVVPIVDHNGNFQGWATFHVTAAHGASDKTLSGYFKDNFQAVRLSVGCANGQCPRYFGTYVLKLIK
jgi:Flp pilus assembly protein TadG